MPLLSTVHSKWQTFEAPLQAINPKERRIMETNEVPITGPLLLKMNIKAKPWMSTQL